MRLQMGRPRMESNVASANFTGLEDDPFAAQATLTAGQAEARFAEEFILSKRLRITAIVSLAFGIILCFFVLLFGLFFLGRFQGDEGRVVWISALVLCGCIVLFGFAYIQTRKKHIGLATASTLLATDITITWF